MKAHAPVPYDAAVLHAVRALRAGTASTAQQKTALDWIEYVACDVEGMSYFDDGEGGDRASSFHEGRRFVGNQIRKMSNPLTLAALEAGNARRKTTSREAKSDE